MATNPTNPPVRAVATAAQADTQRAVSKFSQSLVATDHLWGKDRGMGNSRRGGFRDSRLQRGLSVYLAHLLVVLCQRRLVISAFADHKVAAEHHPAARPSGCCESHPIFVVHFVNSQQVMQVKEPPEALATSGGSVIKLSTGCLTDGYAYRVIMTGFRPELSIG